MIKFPDTNSPRWLVFMLDIFICTVSLVLAYFIRFDTTQEPIEKEFQILIVSFPFYILIRGGLFFLFRTYRGIVRHTSMEDARKIFLSVGTGTLLFIGLSPVRYFFFDGYFFMPMSVVFVEFVTTTFLLITARFAVKLLFAESRKSDVENKNVLIYGAGISGLITKRMIEKDMRIHLNVVGFIDDKKDLSNKSLEGLKIYDSDQTESLIDEFNIEKIIIAIQKPVPENKKKIIELGLKFDIEVLNVPNPKAWINGEFTMNQVRKVKIEDLLGRKPINLENKKVLDEICDKTILISGAAGSIGSEISRQIAHYKPKKIVLLDQAESPLYDLQYALLESSLNVEIDYVIGDIRSEERMRNLFKTFRPDLVYHAAAYKHVPLMEDNPSEAILTNVKGTKILVDLSMEYEVQKFVFVSTDKAVNPTNVMGSSKRIAEIYVQAANQKNKTKFITSRFGNVLGSNGSVIPLFRKQIEAGGPVTVTDARVTRYFMTIPEACQLVLEAGTMGEGGEIYVFDMGESVKILDLAKKMIRLSGLELGRDIEIKIVGLRPGEKLYEELLSNDENTAPTHHPQILIGNVRTFDFDEVQKNVSELIAMYNHQDNFAIVQKMKQIVPEYKSNNSIYTSIDQ